MSTVVLDVRSLDEVLNDVAASMKNCLHDEEFRISFASPELLWSVLNARRWEVLKALCGSDPMSLRELARRLHRGVRGVANDIKVLVDAGIVQRSEDGRITFPHDAIKVELLLRAA